MDRRLCGSCERIYRYDEAIVKILPAPPDAPIRKQGIRNISVRHCPYCGSPEHSADFYPNNQWRNRFSLKTEVKLKEMTVVVSTVNLIFEHSGGFFETMIFAENFSYSLGFQERYWEKTEAVRRHKEIVEMLRKGMYRLTPIEYRIELILAPREEQK